MTAPSSAVTLRAHLGQPLADQAIRSTVIATAHAIAERTGVELLDLHATDDAVTARLASDRIAALGFAAELRRLTNAWHTTKFGAPLWGPEPEREDENPAAGNTDP